MEIVEHRIKNKLCVVLHHIKVLHDSVYIIKFCVVLHGERQYKFSFVETPRKFTWCFHKTKLICIYNCYEYIFFDKTIEIKKIVFFSYFQGDDSDGVLEQFDNNALVIHAMAVVQALKGEWKTFGELCDAILNSILKSARHWKATRLDFVADRYHSISIKDPERN
jgi:hypothetical protein